MLLAIYLPRGCSPEVYDSGSASLTYADGGKNYKLAGDVDVAITGAAGSPLSYTTVVEKINNNSGTILPETGATGTMMFITFGSLFTLLAVVFMVTRKKMSIYKD